MVKIVKSEPEADTATFEDIVGQLDVVEILHPVEDVEADRRVCVQVYMPHVEQWDRDPNMDLTYLWPGGPLQVGDLVVCPPSRFHSGTFTGIVTSLTSDYKGYCKYLLGRADSVEVD